MDPRRRRRRRRASAGSCEVRRTSSSSTMRAPRPRHRRRGFGWWSCTSTSRSGGFASPTSGSPSTPRGRASSDWASRSQPQRSETGPWICAPTLPTVPSVMISASGTRSFSPSGATTRSSRTSIPWIASTSMPASSERWRGKESTTTSSAPRGLTVRPTGYGRAGASTSTTRASPAASRGSWPTSPNESGRRSRCRRARRASQTRSTMRPSGWRWSRWTVAS